MKIGLNEGEMAVAGCIAEMRRLVNRTSGVRDSRLDKGKQAIDLDRDGVVSELAWAKAFGVYPDLSLNPRSGSFDFTLHGVTIDIKSTTNMTGKLLATPKKKNDPADVYVLALVAENIVDFVGYATADEMFADSTLTDLGHGPTHAIKQQHLRRLSPLFWESL